MKDYQTRKAAQQNAEVALANAETAVDEAFTALSNAVGGSRFLAAAHLEEATRQFNAKKREVLAMYRKGAAF